MVEMLYQLSSRFNLENAVYLKNLLLKSLKYNFILIAIFDVLICTYDALDRLDDALLMCLMHAFENLGI